MPRITGRARSLLLNACLLALACVIAPARAAHAPAQAPSTAPTSTAAGAPIKWRSTWNPALFADAAREQRFVLLDLHAVWCHWCHVMDEKTYADPKVQQLIGARYLPVGIDADSDPALASRYGDWGWPATIVLSADGTEIVKRRGFIAPEQMAALLQAIIDDPTPGPSVQPTAPVTAGDGVLSAAARTALKKTYEEGYDAEHGGWGSGPKFIDAPTLEYTLALVLARDAAAERRARQTLDANLALIDPVWGGVYQYSENADWTSPHFEKLLAFQADDLRLYAEGYARWHDPRYLAAAHDLHRYLRSFLKAADGAFYVSQDADLSREVTGRVYYARDAAGRRAAGIPRVDTHEYARENGWAIKALARLYDVTGEAETLAEAETAAEWVLRHRALPHGGFSHDARDAGGPYLEDTLAMGEACLALYRSSGERRWLGEARAAMAFIDSTFRDARGGFDAAPPAPAARGVFADPARTLEQNATLARFANLLHRYTADARYHDAAMHAVRFLAAATAAAAPGQLHADVLLADLELEGAPIHITVVGGKADPGARALHAAALGFPAPYLQVDWWDKSEGALPNPEVQYPQLKRAAAFACTGSSCSLPVFEPQQIAPTVSAALDP